jgi:hypothetical protein
VRNTAAYGPHQKGQRSVPAIDDFGPIKKHVLSYETTGKRLASVLQIENDHQALLDNVPYVLTIILVCLSVTAEVGRASSPWSFLEAAVLHQDCLVLAHPGPLFMWDDTIQHRPRQPATYLCRHSKHSRVQFAVNHVVCLLARSAHLVVPLRPTESMSVWYTQYCTMNAKNIVVSTS